MKSTIYVYRVQMFLRNVLGVFNKFSKKLVIILTTMQNSSLVISVNFRVYECTPGREHALSLYHALIYIRKKDKGRILAPVS